MNKLTAVKTGGGNFENGSIDESKGSKEISGIRYAERAQNRPIGRIAEVGNIAPPSTPISQELSSFRLVWADQRGRASNRRLGDDIRAQAIDFIGMHYQDFGPTLANEKLAELHDIVRRKHTAVDDHSGVLAHQERCCDMRASDARATRTLW